MEQAGDAPPAAAGAQNVPPAAAAVPPGLVAPVMMAPDQMQQLLSHVGQPAAGPRNPVIKLPVLEKTEAVDFLTWKHLVLIGIAGLPADDRVRRQQIALSVQGAAARATQHINWEAHTVDSLLKAYEKIFVSDAASNLSLITFEQAEQSESESVIRWHSRLRVLFRQAYPDEEQCETSRTLIQRFVRGLADPVVCQQVWRKNPGNYQDALTAAQDEVAALGMIQHKTGSVMAKPLRVKEELHLNAISCWNCGNSGHVQRDCSAPRAGPSPSGKRGRPGRKGRGAPGGGARGTLPVQGTAGRKAGNGRAKGKGINCLTEPSTAQEEESWEN